jgi:hypothetical protein
VVVTKIETKTLRAVQLIFPKILVQNSLYNLLEVCTSYLLGLQTLACLNAKRYDERATTVSWFSKVR